MVYLRCTFLSVKCHCECTHCKHRNPPYTLYTEYSIQYFLCTTLLQLRYTLCVQYMKPSRVLSDHPCWLGVSWEKKVKRAVASFYIVRILKRILQKTNCTITLHYTRLHYTTLHYTRLHYTTLHGVIL